MSQAHLKFTMANIKIVTFLPRSTPLHSFHQCMASVSNLKTVLCSILSHCRSQSPTHWLLHPDRCEVLAFSPFPPAPLWFGLPSPSPDGWYSSRPGSSSGSSLPSFPPRICADLTLFSRFKPFIIFPCLSSVIKTKILNHGLQDSSTETPICL